MDRVEQFKKAGFKRLFWLWLASSLIMVDVFWALTRFMAIPELIAIIISLLVSGAISLIMISFINKWQNKPLVSLMTALEHVSANEPHDIRLAGLTFEEYIRQQIFKLVGQAEQLTSGISSQHEFVETVANLIPQPLMVFDKNEELIFYNSAVSEALKIDKFQLAKIHRGRLLDFRFGTEDDYDKWLQSSRKSQFRTSQLWKRVKLLTPANTMLIGDVIAHYEKDESHGIETVIIFVDRTAEYSADESQLDFVSVAAHELRGPITVIRGYLDVFISEMKQDFSEEQRNLLQKMIVSAEVLSLYINNILNVSRLEQHQPQLHLKKANWAEVLGQALSDLNLRAQTQNKFINIVIPDNLPAVAVDQISITEVINNLVDNAIKYSSEGSQIDVRVEFKEGMVVTTVRDFGIGIPSAVVGQLFSKFYRSHRTKQGVSGTGLGLYLSKSIVDAHYGSIWVSSKEGEGSVFGFELPTFDAVASKLEAGDNKTEEITRSPHGWIKNHSMYRR